MNQMITIDQTMIKNDSPAYLIAEIGLNHNNDPELTRKMIKKASQCGANAVKFQLFKTENLLLPDSAAYSLFKNLEMTDGFLKTIIEYCREINITFLASPFCCQTADRLEEMETAAFKIASMDLTYSDFLAHIARKKRPIILSTGMSSLSEIDQAVNTIVREGNDRIILLHCISNYPARPRDMDLKMITRLNILFPDFPIGFSDHSLDNTASIAARVLGAAVFERHFTLDRNLEGPDHKISLQPEQLSDLRQKLTAVDECLQSNPVRQDSQVSRGARRSLYAAVRINKNEIIEPGMIKAVRPGDGLAPDLIGLVIGKKAGKNIQKNEKIDLADLG